MIFLKPIARKTALTGFIFFLSFITVFAQDGKQLFQQNCQACHAINKKLSGPALAGVTERGPWTDRKNLYEWVHNPGKFIPTTPYTKALQAEYGQIMPGFPQLTEKDIDAIVDFISTPQEPTDQGGGVAAATQPAAESGNSAIIFGIISIILAIIALILLQVNSNLKKLSDDKEGILRPEAVPFYRNKIYISLLALLLFAAAVLKPKYFKKSLLGDFASSQPLPSISSKGSSSLNSSLLRFWNSSLLFSSAKLCQYFLSLINQFENSSI